MANWLSTRWRAGKKDQVTLDLPVLGNYSPTASYDFPKALSLQKAEAVRKTIREIREMTVKPDLVNLPSAR